MFKESKNIQSAKNYNKWHGNIKQKKVGDEPSFWVTKKKFSQYKLQIQNNEIQNQISISKLVVVDILILNTSIYYDLLIRLCQYQIVILLNLTYIIIQNSSNHRGDNMAYLNDKFKEQHAQFSTFGTSMQKNHHPIRQMLHMTIRPQSINQAKSELKPKELNFENITQVVLFFRNWKCEPAQICQQMRENKWSDTEISTFCFNCQFVQYLVDLHAQMNGQDSSQPQLKQIKHWYRKLSLYIQKQSIKITKHDLKKSDIKNLEQIYLQSRNFINNFKQRSQTITEYSQNVLNLTKNILTTKKYEKLSIITFALSLAAMFIILCTIQYINVINDILNKSSVLTGQHKAKLIQLWSIASITGILINSLIIVITLFFVIKKFSTYFEIAFTKLSGLESENKGKQNAKEQIIKNKK